MITKFQNLSKPQQRAIINKVLGTKSLIMQWEDEIISIWNFKIYPNGDITFCLLTALEQGVDVCLYSNGRCRIEVNSSYDKWFRSYNMLMYPKRKREQF